MNRAMGPQHAGALLLLVAVCPALGQTRSQEESSTGRVPPNMEDASTAGLPEREYAECAALLDEAGSRNRARRLQAVVDLAGRVTPAHLPLLHHTAQTHRVGWARNAAIDLIEQLGRDESVHVLIDVLATAESEWVRRNAALALGSLEAFRAQRDLAAALMDDPTPRVRKGAAVALGRLKVIHAQQSLEAALTRETDGEVRAVVREALARRDQPVKRRAAIRPGRITEGFFKTTRYLLYVPTNYAVSDPPKLLVSVHGTHGLPEGYMDICLTDAERFGHAVIAPHFDYATFPDFGHLNPWFGGQRADLRLLEIVDYVTERLRCQSERFYLFGHSQGGQFVHRFVMVHSERILKAAACAAGNYVHPDPDDVFPFGTAANPLMPDVAAPDYARLVRAPLAIVIGSRDLDRRQKEARGFIAEAMAYAFVHRLPCGVRCFVVPDGPHAGKRNYPTAAKFLFADESSTDHAAGG